MMSNVFYKIYGNIDAIGRQEWDAVFGDIPEAILFTGPLKFRARWLCFYYLAVCRGNETVLIAPLFCRF